MKRVVELLIIVLGHLVPSSFCCKQGHDQVKMLCVCAACGELKLAGGDATACSATRLGKVPWEGNERNEGVLPPPSPTGHLPTSSGEKESWS